MITSDRIINFTGKKIKRIIEINKLRGLTYNKMTKHLELVFHIDDESDY